MLLIVHHCALPASPCCPTEGPSPPIPSSNDSFAESQLILSSVYSLSHVSYHCEHARHATGQGGSRCAAPSNIYPEEADPNVNCSSSGKSQGSVQCLCLGAYNHMMASFNFIATQITDWGCIQASFEFITFSRQNVPAQFPSKNSHLWGNITSPNIAPQFPIPCCPGARGCANLPSRFHEC